MSLNSVQVGRVLLLTVMGVLCLSSWAPSPTLAAPPERRLDAEQRQRLRHELNQQWHGNSAALEPGMATPAATSGPPTAGTPGMRPMPPGRLSPEERHELRRQLRQQYRHNNQD
jgi:hypothetical protein